MEGKKIGGWMARGGIAAVLNAGQLYVANHRQRRFLRFVEGRKV